MLRRSFLKALVAVPLAVLAGKALAARPLTAKLLVPNPEYWEYTDQCHVRQLSDAELEASNEWWNSRTPSDMTMEEFSAEIRRLYEKCSRTRS